MNFEYKVTIIIPVYNAGEFIEECLSSVIGQTFEKAEMEVLLIDDGSTDCSADICKRYCEKYQTFNYIYKENSGVSATRNVGIRNSHGKYIIFLDSDDKITERTVENLYNYFETVYDEIDLLTYSIQPYIGEKMLPPHSRYKNVLNHTSVYDLEENPYVIQTTMNICVKNFGNDNEYFNEDMTTQEDQEYINRILMKKLKIGYCAQACYLYNKSNENSCVASKFHAYYLFEPSMKYFEDLFSKFKDRVPRYFQALFFHDLRWKLTSKILYPFHYEKEDFKVAINRIKKLLERVDVEIITKNPDINKKHIHYWLNLKPNVFPSLYVNDNTIDVIADGKTISTNKRYEIRLCKIDTLSHGKFRVRGIIEMPIYNYIDEKPDFYVIENENTQKKLDLYDSSYSYVATNIITNKIYGFVYDFHPEEVNIFSFKSIVDSYEYDVRMGFMENAIFQHSIRRYSFARNGYLLSYFNDSISITKMSKNKIYEYEKNQVEIFDQETYIHDMKLKAIDYRYNHRVWLYSDLNTVLKDNAYYQFCNDFKKNDGVERYYIYTRPYEEIECLFNEEQKKYLVEFGSYQHHILYLSSEIIFSSFFGDSAISPFKTLEEECKVSNIKHFKSIYMQHGILHASFVNKYSSEKANCSHIVVSSHFEIENLTKKYQYNEDELIKCGMPRYAHINKESTPSNKILLAPSWRSYFTYNEKINDGNFIKSEYFKGFSKFLNDKRLDSLLKKNNIVLDVKMHPIIQDVISDLFENNCESINIVKGDINIENYKMFITDFSSFVFDYAYLQRPIMYFVPDYEQFKSGMNLYRELDLPFDKAFGNLVKNPDDAYFEIEKIINNEFKPEQIYYERMKDFYLPMNNCEEDIYEYIIKNILV